ncbi:hypothetical protein F441_07612 [Phytophthora nicotianae CJ01A1]|uniref:Uncharacterized protein n=1 Tax=Phytophthora nicotianae CJ01A1 TaxID=1317063 RepID=W2X874_PHYNI|nr:hypothetical protein F441_07612 [Phytophthora nicotianae CJ01A1]
MKCTPRNPRPRKRTPGAANREDTDEGKRKTPKAVQESRYYVSSQA